YTVGLKYQPLQELTFRVSRATAFLPPTSEQLLKNPYTDFERFGTLTPVIDPRTGLPADVDTQGGGNPDVRPENSRSLNAGLIWEPRGRFLNGLRLDVEYYNIEQFNVIRGLDTQAVLDNESTYPDRVTRDGSGAITLVDVSSLNLFHNQTEGL